MSGSRDLICEYLSFVKVEKGLSKNSIESYGRDLAKLRAWADKNGLDVVRMTRQDLREWMIDLGRSDLSVNSKRRLISVLRGFYKFLMIDGHTKENRRTAGCAEKEVICRGPIRPKRTREPCARYLDLDRLPTASD